MDLKRKLFVYILQLYKSININNNSINDNNNTNKDTTNKDALIISILNTYCEINQQLKKTTTTKTSILENLHKKLGKMVQSNTDMNQIDNLMEFFDLIDEAETEMMQKIPNTDLFEIQKKRTMKMLEKSTAYVDNIEQEKKAEKKAKHQEEKEEKQQEKQQEKQAKKAKKQQEQQAKKAIITKQKQETLTKTVTENRNNNRASKKSTCKDFLNIHNIVYNDSLGRKELNESVNKFLDRPVANVQVQQDTTELDSPKRPSQTGNNSKSPKKQRTQEEE